MILSRAVEEPIEATYDLGDDIKVHSKYLKNMVIACILGCIAALLLISSNTYEILLSVLDLFKGEVDLSGWDLTILMLSGLTSIILYSMLFTVLLYLVQIQKFNGHLKNRFEIIDGLQMSPENGPGGKKIKISTPPGSKTERHYKNPIHAMLGLIEESMHEVPQLTRLLILCKYFLSVVLIFIEINVALRLLFDTGLFYRVGYPELGLNILLLVLLILSILFIRTSESFLSYLQTRHEIINDIRFGEPKYVPDGKNRLSRLIKYLSSSDPYIIDHLNNNGRWDSKKIELKGRSGGMHKFDAYLSGRNNLVNLSSKMFIPNRDISVFIRTFDSEITLKAIKEYIEAVKDVIANDNSYPLRIIALQENIAELDGSVYEYVLEEPIVLGGSATNIQIAAEDGDMYSFIPQISYGK